MEVPKFPGRHASVLRDLHTCVTNSYNEAERFVPDGTVAAVSELCDGPAESQIAHVATNLSSAITRFVVCWGGERKDLSDCKPFAKKLEAAVLLFLYTYHRLRDEHRTTPKDEGCEGAIDGPRWCEAVVRELKERVLSVLRALSTLIEAFQLVGAGSEVPASTAGVAIEACDELTAFKCDNNGAVMREIRKTVALLRDATDEMKNALECPADGSSGGFAGGAMGEKVEDDEESWEDSDDTPLSESERIVASSCQTLVSTVVGLNRGTVQLLKSGSDSSAWLDRLNEHLRKSSALVDDLVSSVCYPPQDRSEVTGAVSALIAFVGDALCVLGSSPRLSEDIRWTKMNDMIRLMLNNATEQVAICGIITSL